jgi:hypothetical protein
MSLGARPPTLANVMPIDPSNATSAGYSPAASGSLAARAQPLSRALRKHFSQPESSTTQTVIVNARAATTFDAIRGTDFADSRVVMALSRLRGLPDRLIRRLRGLPAPPAMATATLDDLIAADYWLVLEDRPPVELALGLSMWDRRTQTEGNSMAHFLHPGPGAVRVGWAFTVAPIDDERTLLVTETRTQAADEKARRRFRLYWRLISRFADVTRLLALKAIATEAEQRSNRESNGADDRVTPEVGANGGEMCCQQSDWEDVEVPNSTEHLHTVGNHEREIRARRDAMCRQQREWEDFDVPGDAAVSGSQPPAADRH